MIGQSFPELLAEPRLRSLSAAGGIGLMNGRTGVRAGVRGSWDAVPVSPADTPFSIQRPRRRIPARRRRLGEEILGMLDKPTLVIIVSTSPSAASAADGDELGTVIAAWGDPGRAAWRRMASRTPSPPTPRGAPASSPTSTLPRPSPSGWICRTTPARRSSAPASPRPSTSTSATSSSAGSPCPPPPPRWGVMMLFGLAAVVALALRRRGSPPAARERSKRSRLPCRGSRSASCSWASRRR